MITAERERINTLIDIALHMAQELTDLVDEARESSGDDYGKWISGAADQREMDKLEAGNAGS